LVEFLRSIDVRAPDALHHRIEALVDESSARGRRRSPGGQLPGLRLSSAWRLGGAAAVLAAATVALVIGLTGGGSAALNVREVSASTLRPATIGAPAENPRQPSQLVAAVQGVAFPYWKDRFGWRSTGARADRIDGRAVTTVFYASRGRRIGYAILAGTPAPGVSGGTVVTRGGTPYHLLTEGGVNVVIWVRDGHLCVVAGRGVNAATLLRLASSPAGSVAA